MNPPGASKTGKQARSRLRDENRSLRELLFLEEKLVSCASSDDVLLFAMNYLLESASYQGALLLCFDEEGNLGDERWGFHPESDVEMLKEHLKKKESLQDWRTLGGRCAYLFLVVDAFVAA